MSKVLDQTRPKPEKLSLVLDLDNTLLESRRAMHFGTEEKASLLSQDGFFMTESVGFVVKLRPFVREFLEEASTMFKMHVFTLATKDYATEVVRILDPDGKYFDGRVVSKDDNPWADRNQKRLQVAGVEDWLALIVDDNKKVWSHHVENLIQISRYHFFKDKLSADGEPSLREVLRTLRWVHQRYHAGAERDVRRVLDRVMKDVTKGCILASDSDSKITSDNIDLWCLTYRFESKCTTKRDPFKTRVIPCVVM